MLEEVDDIEDDNEMTFYLGQLDRPFESVADVAVNAVRENRKVGNKSIRKKEVTKMLSTVTQTKQSWKSTLTMQSWNWLWISVLRVLTKVQMTKWKYEI